MRAEKNMINISMIERWQAARLEIEQKGANCDREILEILRKHGFDDLQNPARTLNISTFAPDFSSLNVDDIRKAIRQDVINSFAIANVSLSHAGPIKIEETPD